EVADDVVGCRVPDQGDMLPAPRREAGGEDVTRETATAVGGVVADVGIELSAVFLEANGLVATGARGRDRTRGERVVKVLDKARVHPELDRALGRPGSQV